MVREEQGHDVCFPVAHDLVGAVATKRMPPVVWVTMGVQGTVEYPGGFCVLRAGLYSELARQTRRAMAF